MMQRIIVIGGPTASGKSWIAREVARVLAVSESQVRNWQRAGVLREVRLPGIRAVRFTRADVEQLAQQWTGTV